MHTGFHIPARNAHIAVDVRVGEAPNSGRFQVQQSLGESEGSEEGDMAIDAIYWLEDGHLSGMGF